MNYLTERIHIRKLTWMGQCLVCLVIIASFIGCNYFYYNYIKTCAEEVQFYNIVAEEDIIYSPFLEEGDCLQQAFRPKSSELTSIIIRLQKGREEVDDKGILRITLSQDGEVIAQEEVTSSALSDEEFYVFSIEKKVSKSKDCIIRIQNDMASGQSYAIGVSSVHAEGNQGNCEYNGTPLDGELEVNYLYAKMNKTLVRNWMLKDFLFVLGMALLILVNKQLVRFEKVHKLLGVLYWLLVPIVTFVAVEYVAGNLQTLGEEALYKNIIIYYVIYFALSLVLLKISTVSFLYVMLFMSLALVQYFVTMFRGRPFMLQDIASAKTAATVASTYYFEIGPIMFYMLLFGIVLLVVSGFFKDSFLKGKYYIRVICLSICVGLLCGAGAKYGKILPSINMWFLNENYKENGLLLTLMGQVPYLSAKEPENYSIEAVKNIAKEHSEVQASGILPENIILIMNESFSDLEYIAEVQTDTKLLPFWKNLSENVIKGYLHMPVFGANTANSEYEVLTGNSMEFMVSGSVPYQVNVQEGAASMVSVLEAQGYESIALHPYVATNWNRNNVYNFMGFDEFISMENWGEYELLRWCPSDQSAYEKLIEVCEKSEENMFVFLVTMQNHGGYATDYENFDVDIKLNYDVDYPQAERYLSLLQESDRAYKKLIEYFEQEDDSTMIIMFGDHQAAIENEYYEELFGKSLGELSFEEQQKRYVTPFMIWTNYDIEEQNDVVMSSNYFGSYIMKLAGVELPVYNQFLLGVMEEIPIIGVGGICNCEGMWYDWNNVPEQYKEVINSYKILQYNNVYDRKNRVDTVFEIELEE